MVYTSTARLNYDCQSQRLGISILFKRESLLHSVVGEPKVIGHQVKYRLCFPSSHKHRDHNHSRTHRNRGLCRNALLRERCIVQTKQKNQAKENPHRSELPRSIPRNRQSSAEQHRPARKVGLEDTTKGCSCLVNSLSGKVAHSTRAYAGTSPLLPQNCANRAG